MLKRTKFPAERMHGEVIDIQAEKWEIEAVDGLDEGAIMGRAGGAKQKILISTQNRDPGSTLFHEVLHIIALNLGLDLEESEVLALESGIRQAMRHNKLLREAFLEWSTDIKQ